MVLDCNSSPLALFQYVITLHLSKNIFSLLLNAVLSGFHFIWHARNKCFFEEEFLPIHRVVVAISNTI